MELRNPKNEGLIACLERSDSTAPLLESVEDANFDPYREAGSHPDVVERVWDELGAEVPPDSRRLVFGTPVLLRSESGTILAVALGTTYALRIPPDQLQTALSLGFKQVYHYSSTATTLDAARQFGRDWVFGQWDEAEVSWCRSAHGAAI